VAEDDGIEEKTNKSNLQKKQWNAYGC
jgi:hypothetical protein